MNARYALVGIVVALSTALPSALAKERMELQQKHEIHLECEQLIYLFLEAFESEHTKVADLMSEDGQAFGATGPDAIREKLLSVETRAKKEENALIATNVLIKVADENHASGKCYLTTYQHNYPDTNRAGQAKTGVPASITSWNWEFKHEHGEWKISKMTNKLVMLDEKLFRYLPENRAKKTQTK